MVRALAADTDFDLVLKLLFREAWFRDAILYLDGLDALRGDGRALQYQRLTTTLSADMGYHHPGRGTGMERRAQSPLAMPPAA